MYVGDASLNHKHGILRSITVSQLYVVKLHFLDHTVSN